VVTLSTIRHPIRFLILKIGFISVRSIASVHVMLLMRVLAELLADAHKTTQTVCGTAQRVTVTHLALVTEINLHAKRLHIIPAVVGVM